MPAPITLPLLVTGGIVGVLGYMALREKVKSDIQAAVRSSVKSTAQSIAQKISTAGVEPHYFPAQTRAFR